MRVRDRFFAGEIEAAFITQANFFYFVRVYRYYTCIYTHNILLSPKRIKTLIQIFFLDV
jgi:hypothetical protein